MRMIPALTGIRGIAALTVFVGHVQQQYFGMQTTVLPYVGMTIFFTLSGFVIHWNYAQQLKDNGWRIFFVARFARLYPMHLAVVILVVLTTKTSPVILFEHLLMAQTWVPPAGFPNQAYYNTWSVSTEWFFYFIYAIGVVSVVGRCKATPLLLTIAALSFAIHWLVGPPQTESDMWIRYFSPYLRILEFFTGIATADLAMRSQMRAPYLLCGIICFATLYVLTTPFGGATVISYLFAPLTAAVMFAACSRNRISEFFANRPLCWIGDRSYSFYLLQSVLIVFISPFAQNLSLENALQLSIALFLFLLIVSHLCWRYYEEPARRFIRSRVGGRWNERSVQRNVSN